MFPEPRSSTIALILAINTVIVSVAEVMVVDTESGVTASMMCFVRTHIVTSRLILGTITVYFSITSVRVSYTLFSALKAGRIQSYCTESRSDSSIDSSSKGSFYDTSKDITQDRGMTFPKRNCLM
jgi:hypothetical protein